MTERDKGPERVFPSDRRDHEHRGMTLRDYFAAVALQGLLTSQTWTEESDFTKVAYDMADAMLEARKT